MKAVSVLLVDDQILFVESLKGVIDLGYPEIEVIGVAHNGLEAIELARKALPDVVLMDVRMPEMDGVEATGIIHEELPNVRVIMLTTFDDDEYVQEAIARGAVGYVLKSTPVHDLVGFVRVVHDGAFIASPSIVEKIARKVAERPPNLRRGSTVPEWFERLTPREKEILFFMANGYDNKTIASRMHLAEQTTRNRVSRIYSKMGVRDRPNAVRLILEANIGLLRAAESE